MKLSRQNIRIVLVVAACVSAQLSGGAWVGNMLGASTALWIGAALLVILSERFTLEAFIVRERAAFMEEVAEEELEMEALQRAKPR